MITVKLLGWIMIVSSSAGVLICYFISENPTLRLSFPKSLGRAIKMMMMILAPSLVVGFVLTRTQGQESFMLCTVTGILITILIILFSDALGNGRLGKIVIDVIIVPILILTGYTTAGLIAIGALKLVKLLGSISSYILKLIS